MIISVFTGRDGDPERTQAVRAAIATAGEHGADMLLLPGNSLGNGNHDGRVLQGLANEMGVSILAEVNGITSLFRQNEPPRQFPEQQFAFSSRDREHPDEQHVTPCKARKVIELLNNRNRVFNLAGKRIAVLLCGENNILRNVKAEHDAARPRYDDIDWPFKVYNVLVNPAHTSMGYWRFLHKRFAYFSRGGRTVIHCTNNTHNAWGTSLCVYQNGEKCVMGDLENTRGWRSHPQGNWRMVTVEV